MEGGKRKIYLTTILIGGKSGPTFPDLVQLGLGLVVLLTQAGDFFYGSVLRCD